MLKIFRLISALEGLSYIVILSVSIGILSRDYVYNLGMIHGLLFTLYLLLSLQVSHKYKLPLIHWLLLFTASLVPFAFIPAELFLKKLGLSESKEQDS